MLIKWDALTAIKACLFDLPAPNTKSKEMELTVVFLLFQISALLLCFALSLQFLHRKKATESLSKRKLPPGPWTLPFIGNLHNLAGAGSPQHALRDLARSHGPVMLLRTGQTDLVVITSRVAAREVHILQSN